MYEQMLETGSLAGLWANPFVINIHEAAVRNDNYRTALWTGAHCSLP